MWPNQNYLKEVTQPVRGQGGKSYNQLPTALWLMGPTPVATWGQLVWGWGVGRVVTLSLQRDPRLRELKQLS